MTSKVRSVKPRSDRGSLKDVKERADEFQSSPYEIKVSNLEPAPFELRVQKLFEYAKQHNDSDLMAASGVITTDYIQDKNALPLSVYRIRQTVNDIKSKSANIDQLTQEFLGNLMPLEVTPDANAYWDRKLALKKVASARKPPVFRRAHK